MAMIPFSAEDVSVFSFTGIYEQQDFWRELSDGPEDSRFYDLKELRGTDGYLSEEAAEILKNMIDEVKGVHFIDSGNTHYMTKLFTDRLRTPFCLVLLDHHPDMQPPAFGSLLSCGSWLRAALDENPYLSEVIMLGVDSELARGCGADAEERVRFLTDPEELADLLPALPVYLSIDKDVLSPAVLTTNWDQGQMEEETLFSAVGLLCGHCGILGVDVCGECGRGDADAAGGRLCKQNDDFNAKLLDFLLGHR